MGAQAMDDINKSGETALIINVIRAVAVGLAGAIIGWWVAVSYGYTISHAVITGALALPAAVSLLILLNRLT